MADIRKPGDKVGKYEIVKLIRDGNYATAYEARDGSKKIFLKIYSDPTSILSEYESFIRQQEYVCKILNNLVYTEKVYELFEIEFSSFKWHCQAKEFMTGIDLGKFLEGSPNYETRKVIALVLLYALNEIHKAGLVHTDLKPDQIFMKEDKDLKYGYVAVFCDFDFCKVPGKYEPVYKVSTPFYSSPEYLMGEEVSYEADVFTMGIIIYKVLTGQEPYPIVDQDEYAKAVFENKIKPPHEHDSLIDEKTSELILRMLDPNKSNRPKLMEVHESLSGKKAAVSPVRSKYRLVFVEENSKNEAYFHKSQLISRSDLRIFTDYKYVDQNQFEIIQSETTSKFGWKIKSRKDVVNPTYLGIKNISEAGGEYELEEGSEVFIGNIAKKIGLKLKVKFEEIK